MTPRQVQSVLDALNDPRHNGEPYHLILILAGSMVHRMAPHGIDQAGLLYDQDTWIQCDKIQGIKVVWLNQETALESAFTERMN